MSADPNTQTDLNLLAIVDGLAAQVQMLRAEIVRRDEALDRGRALMIDAARGVAKADELTCKETARFLGLSLSAIQQGMGGTRCLYRARIKNGRKITHLRKRVEAHRQNVIESGECDRCDREVFARQLRPVK